MWASDIVYCLTVKHRRNRHARLLSDLTQLGQRFVGGRESE